ncbi:hypothetical protein LTR36_002923 [Oleoguttula mirabilis]|uniref:C2H2-type domain-containing protein n=1 Tax=Oleoguttula mirabilis TaxID=1507867 RepID=A0AAV9JL21_9PEZI|nr:hypothetical protein LTR36_002923 [Oleoguttula mirabilis]
MASDSNDFTLYPFLETWNEQNYLPTSLTDNSYMHPTPFDAFQAQQAYAQPGQQLFSFNTESYPQAKNHLQPQSPNYSPSNSASNSFDFQHPPILSSTSDSGASVQSTISSAMGSPSVQHQASNDWNSQQHMAMLPGIVQHDSIAQDLFATTNFDLETIPATEKGCVGEFTAISSSQQLQAIQPLDLSSLPFSFNPMYGAHPAGYESWSLYSGELAPNAAYQNIAHPAALAADPSLIQPYSPTQLVGIQFPEMQAANSPHNLAYPQAASPVPSKHSIHSPRMSTGKAPSPYTRTQPWQPYPAYPSSRRQSISSVHSRHSQGSLSSDDSNKGLCLIPTCGRHVKDLKAHMLTHQNERPEKCPIPTCEYHTKGFARKYDKNRHTLTHYKGTMVCGFCPGSGSAAEKSFNRADVFKRHLTSVHGVEQTPPNARRKSPTTGASKRPFGAREASGMCSTCGVTFPSAQDFYEHLDDCVLRVVQQADPSEAINEKLLSSVADDKQVQETMERHMLPSTTDLSASTSFDEEEVEEDEEAADEDDTNDGTYGSRNAKSGKGALKSRKSAAAGTSS